MQGLDVVSQLKARWREEWGTDARLATLRPHLNNTLGVHISMRDQAKKLAENQRMSPLGRKEALAEFAAGEPVKAMYTAKRARVITSSEIDATYAALGPRVADKTNAADAVLRSDLRGFLLDLSPLERVAHLFDAKSDPRLVVAALEAPDAIIGISPAQRQQVIDVYVERSHPGIVATLETRREAVEVLDVALQVAKDSIYHALEFQHERGWQDFWEAASAPMAKAYGAIDEAAANTAPDFQSVFEMILKLPENARNLVYADFDRIKAEDAQRKPWTESYDPNHNALDSLRGGPLGLALTADERARLAS